LQTRQKSVNHSHTRALAHNSTVKRMAAALVRLHQSTKGC
jgi:hypothetical protein